MLMFNYITPVMYTDPSGYVVFDLIIDVGSIMLSLIDLCNDPSWENVGWLALDIFCAIVPFLTGSRVLKAASKINDYDTLLKYGDEVVMYSDEVIQYTDEVIKTHKHHSYPKYLGGHPKQITSVMIDVDHRALHSGLSKFEGGWLYPRRNFNGKKIQRLYGPDLIQDGLRRYYGMNYPLLLDDLDEAIRFTNKIT